MYLCLLWPAGWLREALSAWTQRCWKKNRGVSALDACWDLLSPGRCVVHCSGHLTAHIKPSQRDLHKHGLRICVFTSLLFHRSVRAIQPSDIHFISISAGQVRRGPGAPPASGQIQALPLNYVWLAGGCVRSHPHCSNGGSQFVHHLKHQRSLCNRSVSRTNRRNVASG